jgi:hypothetical protein
VQRLTEPHKRPHRPPKYKTAYRVNNWREYDQSLRARGDITLWISQDAIHAWTPPQTGKRGLSSSILTLPLRPRSRSGSLSPAPAANGRLSPCPLDPDGRDASLPGSYDALATPCHSSPPTARRACLTRTRCSDRRQYGIESLWSRGMAHAEARGEAVQALEETTH